MTRRAYYVAIAALLIAGIVYAVAVWRDCRGSGHSVLFCVQHLE